MVYRRGVAHWHDRRVGGDGSEEIIARSWCGMGQAEGAVLVLTPDHTCATCRRLLAKDAERRARSTLMEEMWAQTAAAMAAHVDAQFLAEVVPEAREDLDAYACREFASMRAAKRVEAFRDAGWVPMALHEAVTQGAFQRGREALLTEAMSALQKRAEAYRVLGKFGSADVVGEAMDRLAVLVVKP
jgi:hypothetical protein